MPAVFEAKFADFANDVMLEQKSMLDAVTQSPESIRRGLPTTPPKLGQRRPITPAAPQLMVDPAVQKYLDSLDKNKKK